MNIHEIIDAAITQRGWEPENIAWERTESPTCLVFILRQVEPSPVAAELSPKVVEDTDRKQLAVAT